MKTFLFFITTFVLIIPAIVNSQTINIIANKEAQKVQMGHLKMGHPGSEGKEILVNSKYITYAGKPIIPVMGEMHYARVNQEKWEETILKMKANGITIIATYVFWIHHEEIEGVFEWNGNNNLRAFIELCKKNDLWVYLRIGPWCHGEVRNGGLPDWLMKKEGVRLRSNDPAYRKYAEKWYKEISKQLDGLYYKDDGPIMGIQIENEYWRGKEGEAHIAWLKQTALNNGINVPIYTVTGWRSASVVENEVIPLWGGYPAAPWTTNVKKIEHNENYLFKKPVNDQSIGHKENNNRYAPDYSLYPYLTCELGIGNQISEHRRPVIDPIDGMAIATSNIASGSNLPGYYVFAGGLNPVGKLTTLEEDRWETGYWNEYPVISYDFQAAISETGEITPAYHKLKPLHYFLRDFGEQLAPMDPVIPENNEKWDNLQYSFRYNENAGFLFVSNYYRGYQKSTKSNVQFIIQFKNDKVTFPSEPIEIADSAVFIWPVNMKLGSVTLQYATAQPICQLNNKKGSDYYFFKSGNLPVEFVLKGEEIKKVTYHDKSWDMSKDIIIIDKINPSIDIPIVIETAHGELYRLFLISQKEAESLWYLKHQEESYLFLSTANLIMDDKGQLHTISPNVKDEIIALNSKLTPLGASKNLEYSRAGRPIYALSNVVSNIPLEAVKSDLIDHVQWLAVSPVTHEEKKVMYHKQFFKEVDLTNTARIRKANCYFLCDETCRMRVNDQWINQSIEAGEVTVLDLTGYLQNGKNKIMLDFPYKREEVAFATAFEVEYYNADKVIFFSDSTWLTKEQYKIPAPWDGVNNLEQPTLVVKPEHFKNEFFTPNRYAVNIKPVHSTQNDVLYLKITYKGNKARCYSGQRLVADNFNNGTTWSINLSDACKGNESELIFELEALSADYQIYFDKVPDKNTLGKASFISLVISHEYRNAFRVLKYRTF